MLDRVTITGADDSVLPGSLVDLSARYPFVEWGILVSRSHVGSPRYPTSSWFRLMQLNAAGLKMSLHLCGHFVRELLLGRIAFPIDILDGFQRVQLNFHAERVVCSPDQFRAALKSLGDRQFIFQVDGANGNKYLGEALASRVIDAVGLFDVSGGAGVLPDFWPGAGSIRPDQYVGYAGGLSPENLVEQIPAIAIAAHGRRHWIDMETRVRSDDDRVFDLGKVETALRIAEGFISRPDLYSRRA
jgi:phosphoribosylanthranilate isomerase